MAARNKRLLTVAIIVLFAVGMALSLGAIINSSLHMLAAQPTGLSQGTVTAKDHTVAQNYELIQNVNGVTATRKVSEPERYTVTVEGKDADGKDIKGIYEVTDAIYNQVQVGQTVDTNTLVAPAQTERDVPVMPVM